MLPFKLLQLLESMIPKVEARLQTQIVPLHELRQQVESFRRQNALRMTRQGALIDVSLSFEPVLQVGWERRCRIVKSDCMLLEVVCETRVVIVPLLVVGSESFGFGWILLWRERGFRVQEESVRWKPLR